MVWSAGRIRRSHLCLRRASKTAPRPRDSEGVLAFSLCGGGTRTCEPVCLPYNEETACPSPGDGRGRTVKRREALLEKDKTPGAVLITRRDFLKIGGGGLAGAVLLGTAGCGVFQQGGQQGGESGDENTLSYNLAGDIPDMDPTTMTDVNSVRLITNVMEGLYRIDENEEPQPAQAEGVEIEDDELTHTFTLRDGIEWSNGDPVTSRDFKYSWLRAMDPDTAAPYSYIIAPYIEGGAEFNAGEGSAEDVAIETPDDRTLRVTLVNPTPFFLGLTAFPTYYPQRQEFVEQRGDQYAQSAEALLYNGPFTMTRFDPAGGATLAKNENYWDKENVAVQRVDCKVVKEVATAVNLYEGGQLDVVSSITSEYVDQYEDDPAFQTVVQFVTWWFAMNFEDEVFQNENIRRAIQISFNGDALADKILNNGSVGAEGIVPPGMAGPGDQTFREAVGPTVPAYDPERARELWQQGVEELGQEPSLTYLSQDNSTARDIATFLQSELRKNLGVTVEVNVQPFDRFIELLDNGEYQLGLYGWIADYNDPMTFLDLWLSDTPLNYSNFQNERYDALINAAKVEPDEQVRMNKLIEAERLLVEEQTAIAPVHHEGAALLVRPSVRNWVQHPTGSIEFKYARVE
jgi:oligopeptide transport system substrate-binding protein